MRLETSLGQIPGGSSGSSQDFVMYPGCDGQPPETETGEDMIVFTFFFLS